MRHGWRDEGRGIQRGSEVQGCTPADAEEENDGNGSDALPVCLGMWKQGATVMEGRQKMRSSTRQRTPQHTWAHEDDEKRADKYECARASVGMLRSDVACVSGYCPMLGWCDGRFQLLLLQVRQAAPVAPFARCAWE